MYLFCIPDVLAFYILGVKFVFSSLDPLDRSVWASRNGSGWNIYFGGNIYILFFKPGLRSGGKTLIELAQGNKEMLKLVAKHVEKVMVEQIFLFTLFAMV